jgi:hypothetical protein
MPWNSHKNNASTVVAIKLAVLGHSSITSYEINAASPNVANLFVLFDICAVLLFEFGLFENPFDLVDFFENIFVFGPFMLEFLND